jgi:hypothetical protein
MTTQRVFFVRHLLDGWPDKTVAQQFEVQLVDRYGRATAWGFVGDLEMSLKIGAVEVPRGVIEAARRQSRGVGDFVDGSGNQVLPRDFGKYITEPCEVDMRDEA